MPRRIGFLRIYITSKIKRLFKANMYITLSQSFLFYAFGRAFQSFLIKSNLTSSTLAGKTWHKTLEKVTADIFLRSSDDMLRDRLVCGINNDRIQI